MPKVNIKLPKDIAEAPAEVREAILKTLRQAMKLPPELKVTHGGDDEHNMWVRNSDPLTADSEDDFYDYLQEGSAQRMAEVFNALGLSVDGVKLEKAFTPEYEEYIGLMKSKDGAWRNARRRLSDLIEAGRDKRDAFLQYVQDNNPLKKTDLNKLDKLLRAKLPDYAKQVEAFMVRAGFLGKIRNEAEKRNLSTMGILVDRYPETIKASTRESVVLTSREAQRAASEGRKVTIMPLTPQEQRSVEHADHSAGDKITEIIERHRAGVRQMVTRAKKERWEPKKLEQELFDLYGEQNRDWRRVAITEMSMAQNDAYLSGLEEGDKVVGMGAENACGYCKKYVIGKTFTVLPKPPERETYDTDMKHVWAGKSNYGRRVAEYVPCAPMHPNCRCRWHRISRFYKTDDSGKFVLKTTAELIQEERLKRGMGLDPNLPPI